jgi:hypothetical protein
MSLMTLNANGAAVRFFVDEDGTPYLCGTDIVTAAGLGHKLNPTNIRRRVGDRATRRIDRRDHPGTFGARGRPDVLFFRFDALEQWARDFPDGAADRLMRGLQLTHFRPFSIVD